MNVIKDRLTKKVEFLEKQTKADIATIKDHEHMVDKLNNWILEYKEERDEQDKKIEKLEATIAMLKKFKAEIERERNQ